MRFGFALRLMGRAARADVLRESARRAEAAGLDTIWVPDHIAIPPDQTQGSGGRYLDPLASLAWLAAATDLEGGEGLAGTAVGGADPLGKGVLQLGVGRAQVERCRIVVGEAGHASVSVPLSANLKQK